MFFTQDLNQKYPTKKNPPNSQPMYMVPLGCVEVPACKFVPGALLPPQHCGGVK